MDKPYITKHANGAVNLTGHDQKFMCSITLVSTSYTDDGYLKYNFVGTSALNMASKPNSIVGFAFTLSVNSSVPIDVQSSSRSINVAYTSRSTEDPDYTTVMIAITNCYPTQMFTLRLPNNPDTIANHPVEFVVPESTEDEEE